MEVLLITLPNTFSVNTATLLLDTSVIKEFSLRETELCFRLCFHML